MANITDALIYDRKAFAEMQRLDAQRETVKLMRRRERQIVRNKVIAVCAFALVGVAAFILAVLLVTQWR